jgi:hypothetical protein
MVKPLELPGALPQMTGISKFDVFFRAPFTREFFATFDQRVVTVLQLQS